MRYAAFIISTIADKVALYGRRIFVNYEREKYIPQQLKIVYRFNRATAFKNIGALNKQVQIVPPNVLNAEH